MKFNELLYKYRTRANIAQITLAGLVGMSQGHLNQIEHGKRNPPKRNKIIQLIAALKMNANEASEFLNAAGFVQTEYNTHLGAYGSPFHLGTENDDKSNNKEVLQGEKTRHIEKPYYVKVTCDAIEKIITSQALTYKQRLQIAEQIVSLAKWLSAEKHK